MLKKLIPVALVGLLAGCAAYQEALSIKDSLQTFLVRSVTMKVGGVDQCKVALIWGGTSALTSLKRDGADVNVDKTKNFGQDDVTPSGASYQYTATFENNKQVVRDIRPYTVGDAGEVDTVSPYALPFATTARSGLKFRWHMKDAAKPNGFMVTVTDTAAPTVPIYNAFIEAASHSVDTDTYEIPYGTPSDMAVLTKEVLDLMAGMDSRFAKTDSGVSSDQLDPNKTYAWIVSPLKIDDKAIRFCIGASSGSGFKVTQ